MVVALNASALAAGGFLGVQLEDSKAGSKVASVVPAGPAKVADLKAGDLIVVIGGKKVESSKDLIRQMQEYSPGDKVRFEIMREGAKKEIEIQIGKRPKPVVVPNALLGTKAPELEIKQWHNLPEGKDEFKLADHEGKTIFLYCFQSW